METIIEVTMTAALKAAFQELSGKQRGERVFVKASRVDRRWFVECLRIGGYVEENQDEFLLGEEISDYADLMNRQTKAFKLASVIDMIVGASRVGQMSIKIPHEKMNNDIQRLLTANGFLIEGVVGGYEVSWRDKK